MLAEPASALVGFDFDGTLAPIVADPSKAYAHPEAAAALAALSAGVGYVAVVTGRPAALAVELGGFAQTPGLARLVVLGQYGVERWDAATGEFSSMDAPSSLDVVRARLPELLAEHDAAEAYVEDKGIAVAVHVRRLRDPEAAFARLRDPLMELAATHGLAAEPGRLVVELRPLGTDKGTALRALVEETRARVVVFVGDDLGDLAAFDAVDQLRSEGRAGLLVCSGSDEEAGLRDRADLVVDGPAGVVDLVQELAHLVSRR